ncbi:MAG: hypothetical protein KAI81_01925, partial [Candidatus Marinimicrobia bacterium]|nr:hypothetical protein [Candidatus Neomarinimicrobiota bacterium]
MTTLSAGPYELIHSPVISYSLQFPLYIEAIFSGDHQQIDKAVLLGRSEGSSMFREYPMIFDGVIWGCSVNEEDLTDKGFEYLIVFHLLSGGIVSFPELNPFTKPQDVIFRGLSENELPEEEISENQQAGTLESGVMILSPEPGAQISAKDIVITLSLFNAPDADLNTVKIFLDGRDLTSFAIITPEVITLTPLTGGLESGIHIVELQLSNHFGAAFKPLQWSFELVAQVRQSEDIFKASGRAALEYRNEMQKGVRNNLSRAKINFSGSAAVVDYGMNVNWVSNESAEFQPRNLYGVYINSEYVDLELGDIYPLFTRTALWGSRIRGVYTNIKVKYINLQFVKGQSLRKVYGDWAYQDSIQNWDIEKYVFARNVIGIKPSFGSSERLNIYVSFLQTRDDTSSIFPPSFIPDYDPLNHSYELKGIKPKDNLVAGFGHSLILDSRKFSWTTDFSISLSNSNIEDGFADTISFGETTFALSDLTGSAFSTSTIAPLFIINENMGIPIPMGIDENYNVQINLKELGAYPTLAYMSILQLDYYGHYINMNVKRVAPEYKALAHNGLMGDNKQTEISDRIRLLSNKMFLNLKYSTQRDNLIEGIKQYTTSGKTNSIGLNLMPGAGFPSMNINMRVFTRSNNASRVDTLVQQSSEVTSLNSLLYSYNDPRVNSQNSSQMINISQPARFFGMKNTINISYMLSKRQDLVPNRPPGYNDISMDMESLTLTAISHVKKNLIQTLSHNRTRNSTSSMQYNYNISTYKLDTRFFDNKVRNSLNLKYTRAFGMVNFSQYTARSDLSIILFGNNLQFSYLFNKIDQGKDVS